MKIKTVLDALNIRKIELARRLGVSRQRVSQWGSIVPAEHAMRLKAQYPRLPLHPEDYAPEAEI